MDFRRSAIIQGILATIAITGMLAVAVVAPNTLQLLKYIPNKKRSYINKSTYINRTSKRLAQAGLLHLKQLPSGIQVYRLTKKGYKELAKYKFGDLSIQKPKKWDGKFRLIIFDIKEWKRNRRDELRNVLIKLGFKRLQNSVWVYPYGCQEIITLLKSDLHIGKEIIYVTAESIENNTWLKQEFGLV